MPSWTSYLRKFLRKDKDDGRISTTSLRRMSSGELEHVAAHGTRPSPQYASLQSPAIRAGPGQDFHDAISSSQARFRAHQSSGPSSLRSLAIRAEPGQDLYNAISSSEARFRAHRSSGPPAVSLGRFPPQYVSSLQSRGTRDGR